MDARKFLFLVVKDVLSSQENKPSQSYSQLFHQFNSLSTDGASSTKEKKAGMDAVTKELGMNNKLGTWDSRHATEQMWPILCMES